MMRLTKASIYPSEKALSMQSSHAPDRTEISFDETHAVANAGLVLNRDPGRAPWARGARERDGAPGDHPGAASPGRKVMTLVQSMVAGGDCIDDAEGAALRGLRRHGRSLGRRRRAHTGAGVLPG